MKTLSTITLFLLLRTFANVNCEQEVISIWAPKQTQGRLPYELLYQTNTLSQQTEISVQFSRSNVTQMIMQENESKLIQFSNKWYTCKNSSDLYITLLRNDSRTMKTMCSTQYVKVSRDNKHYLTFIQLDKLMYKPGEEVHARIIFVDRNLIPMQRNENFNVEVYASNNLLVYKNVQTDATQKGVGEVNFKINQHAVLGKWKIRAFINGYDKFPATKTFDVQKYALPAFEVTFETSDKFVNRNSSLTLSFFARNKFDELLTGNAEITYEISNREITKKFANVTDIQTFNLNVNNDLSTILPEEFSVAFCRATVSFEELKSKVSLNKTVVFAIFGDTSYKIEVKHDETFLAGVPFYVTVKIYDYLNRPVEDHVDRPTFVYTSYSKSGLVITGTLSEEVREEIVYVIKPEKDWKSFDFKVKFVDSKLYTRVIESEKVNTTDRLKVFYVPQNPSLSDDITVMVYNMEQPLDKLVVFLMNAQGTLISKQVECQHTQLCKFKIAMRERYLPQSTLNVYQVIDKEHILRGQINITGNSLGNNQLSLTANMNEAKPKQQVKLTFTGEVGSTVYVLAFDKRLLDLPIRADLIVESLKDGFKEYNQDHEVIFFDDHRSWNECTEEELMRIESGRKRLRYPLKDVLTPSLDHENKEREWLEGEEDLFEEEEEEEVEDNEEELEPSEVVDEFLRDIFPDSWIFDTLSIDGSSTVSKAYTVPDSITTWAVSAFAAVEDQRLAIAPLKELRVENEFYIQVNLPYSIRYKEVLRLDVLVFNYVTSKEELYVQIKLDNKNQNFEFIEYDSEDDFCEPIPNDRIMLIEDVKVPHMSARKVSFYIRSKDVATTDFGRLKDIPIDITAIGIGVFSEVSYIDRINEILHIEPVGFAEFYRTWEFFNVSDGNKKIHSISGDNFTYVTAFISTHLMRADHLISDEITSYWGQSLQDRTSQFKQSVEYLRYRLSKGQHPDPTEVYDNYQSVMNKNSNRFWHYHDSTGFRAYRLNALISMVEVNNYWNITNFERILKKELVQLQLKQAENGHFGPSPFPSGSLENNAKTLFDTAHALIPFLKYQIYKTDKNRFMIPVSKGMNFIDMTVMSGKTLSNEAYSIAAYAYALHGDRKSSTDLIKQLETFSHSSDDKKCYKLSINGTDCDLRTTVFAGLAQITLGRLEEAASIVRWLLPNYNSAYPTKLTFEYAMAAEVISRMANYFESDNFKLDIHISNNMGTSYHFTMNETNKNETIIMEQPEFTDTVIFEVSGNGYCFGTVIFEGIHPASKLGSDQFIVYAETRRNENDRVIRACVKYQENKSVESIMNEIELPTGYALESYLDLSGELASVRVASRGALLILDYREFHSKNTYCTDITVKKVFDVKNLQTSSLKAYAPYSAPVAIGYYHIEPSCV